MSLPLAPALLGTDLEEQIFGMISRLGVASVTWHASYGVMKDILSAMLTS